MAQEKLEVHMRIRGAWIPTAFMNAVFKLYKIGLISRERGMKIVNKWTPILINKFVKSSHEKHK